MGARTTIANKLAAAPFTRTNYTVDSFVSRIGVALTSSTNLHTLLTTTAYDIAEMLQCQHVSFIVQMEDAKPLSIGVKSVKMAKADVDMLMKVCIRQQQFIQTSQVTDADMRAMLIGYQIALVVPLATGKHSVGFLALGERKEGSYRKRDLHALDTVADELVIAVQNALSLKKVKDLNASLQQKIDAATEELRRSNQQLRNLDQAKDEFLSMASHQLRTPLTSVKGYISMVLEGDAGKVNATQQKLLAEAFSSSERMVHLINDFLNVSRIQTGKFMIETAPIDIVKLVRREVASLQTIAKARELTLECEAPDEMIMVEIDEGKIGQVIMNFIDNAIFYTKPGGVIIVKIIATMRAVRVEVTDNGIGVPLEQQQKLFSKFFRADNAKLQRPDGTGVGLFLAKKVVDGHSGKIIFSSKEGKGSTFGFTLTRKNTNHANNKDDDQK